MSDQCYEPHYRAGEVLARCGDVLQAHPERWTQGSGARDEHGRGCYPLDGKAASWCATGLIQHAAAAVFPDFYEQAGKRAGAFDGCVSALCAAMGEDIAEKPYHKKYRETAAIYWNDEQGRTAVDVAALFEKAADLAMRDPMRFEMPAVVGWSSAPAAAVEAAKRGVVYA